MSRDLTGYHDLCIMIMMSLKFQLVLPDDLAHQIKAEAKRQNVSASEFIREAVGEKLAHRERSDKRSFIEKITGICDSDETDLAARVDEILYGG
jgi:metal-responsive CopG/Arc/MetJ family transcriptional regulator